MSGRGGGYAIFHKTKLCKFYMTGQCTRWGSCAFAHHADELQPLPNFYRTRPCPELVETGKCRRGSQCTFAHTRDEMRMPMASHSDPRRRSCQTSSNGSARTAAGGTLSSGRSAEGPADGPADDVTAQVAQLQLIRYTAQIAALEIEKLKLLLQQEALQAASRAPYDSADGVLPAAPAAAGAWTPCGSAAIVLPDAPKAAETRAPCGLPAAEGTSVPLAGDALDEAACGAFFPNSWSRQTTEEGDGMVYEFSRQSTEQAAAADNPLVQENILEEDGQPASEPAQEADGTSVASVGWDEVRKARPGRTPTFSSVTGLRYVVKNSFLEFEADKPAPVLRKVHSEGDI